MFRNHSPRCADSFSQIHQSLGRIEAVTQSTHTQAAATNGRVEDLFAADSSRRAEMARLNTRMQELQNRLCDQESLARTVLTAGWKLSIMLAGTVGTLLGIRRLLNL